MKPRALYFDCLAYRPENLALLRSCFDVDRLPTPDADATAILPEIHVLFAPLGWRVDDALMSRCPRLRAIVSNTTSVSHIDVAAAETRGIILCALHNDQDFLERITPTAEHTIGLLMAAWRRIPAAHSAVLRGEWDRRPWGAPRMLSRLRIGIVGYGRLGRKVAACAVSLGMTFEYFDPYKAGTQPTLLALARHSDALTLHAPATPETNGMISRTVLEALPRGAVLVNTARGDLVDTEALVDLLDSGHLFAAGLDTVAGEFEKGFGTRLLSSRLIDYARTHDNLILTPHIGGSTLDAWFETERRVIAKACEALNLEQAV